MEFKSYTIFTKEAEAALFELTEQVLRPEKKRSRRWLCLVIGAVGLISGVGFHITMPDNRLLSQLSLSYGIVFLLFGLFWKRIASRSATNILPMERFDRRFEFHEDGFSVSSAKYETQYDYSSITVVGENQDWFGLFLDKNGAYLVDKRNFTEGSTEEFCLFLEGKTGLTITKV